MSTVRTVMISSTARDLPAHRDQVMHACLARQTFLPIMMEHLPATTADARRVSVEMVDRADIYVGVFAHRYGYVPPDGDISVTQMEYERAVERGIPRLIFMMADDHPITAADVERGPGATRLDALKDRLKTEHCLRFFSSPADLRAHVLNSLAALDSSAPPAPTSDLTISSLRGGRRLRPLSGHPVLTPEGPDAPVYTGGVHVTFTLAHNGAGTRSINLHAMELEVQKFTAGAQPALAYIVEGAEVIGAGIARPHVFSVAVRGLTVAPARWVLDRTTNAVSQARSENFLDTDDPRVLTFPAGANDIEELQGTITARQPGLYEVRFLFHYSVGGEDRQHASDTIRVYMDE